MKLILLLFSTIPTIVFAQLPDLQSRQSRIAFVNLPDNAIIKNAGIKTERIYTCSTDVQGKTDSILTEEIRYNNMGFIISKTEFTPKATFQKNYTYTFAGGQISRLIIETKAEGYPLHFTEIIYNNAGNELSKYDYDDDHKNEIFLLKEYNIKDQCINLKYLGEDKKYHPAKAYYYNKSGELERTEIFLANAVLKGYLYKTISNREIVFSYKSDTANNEEVASFTYDAQGNCTHAIAQQIKYKLWPSSGDYNVTIADNRSQGVRNMPETYTIPGSTFAPYETTNVTTDKLPDPGRINTSITVTRAKPESGTYISDNLAGTWFFYNPDGTVSSEISKEDNTQAITARKHYYYK